MRACLSLLMVLVLPEVALAEEAPRAVVLERVVAVVDGEPIWMSQVLDRSERVAPSVVRARIERWIDRILCEQAAAQAGVVVSDAEVEQAIERVRRQTRLSRREFAAIVLDAGYRMVAYREAVRRQLSALIFTRGRDEAELRALIARLRAEATIEIRL